MQNVKADFDTRAKEIDEYFDFVKVALADSATLSYQDEKGVPAAVQVGGELQKVLKATGFLLIYNLVESTVSNSIEAIIEHMMARNISFDDLTREIKIIVLKNAKNWNPESLEPNLSQIAQDIIGKTFRKDELFSGNLDARKIRETMNSYGVQPVTNLNSDCLLTIKARRNDLAHGIVSFADCGKDYDVVDLERFKDEAKAYLQATLSNIENFLDNDDYLF